MRQGSAYLQIARQLEVLTSTSGRTDELEEAVSLLQHHDSITGTAKQHVANDYHKRLSMGKHPAILLCRFYPVHSLPDVLGQSYAEGDCGPMGTSLSGDNPCS